MEMTIKQMNNMLKYTCIVVAAFMIAGCSSVTEPWRIDTQDEWITIQEKSSPLETFGI